MTNYYLGAALSFGLSVVLTYAFSRYARSKKIFMPPVRARDIHLSPVPRVGGIAVVVSFLAVLGLWQIFDPQSLRFTGQLIAGIDRNLIGLVLAILVLTAVNVMDDLKGVHWGVKLAAQIVAASLIAYFGIRIQWFSNPFGDRFFLGSLDWIFVVIWLVGMSNVVNWLDGVNGLAGGVSAITLAILFFLSIGPFVAQSENALIAAIAFGAVIGFLPFNAFKAKAFLGDTGSVFLGFLIGVLAIISGGKVATAFLVLAIPFLDAIVVVVSRLLHGKWPFHADKRHLHHRLLEVGFKPWQIVLIFYGVSLLFGLIALNTQSIGKFWAALSALVLMTVLVLLYSYGGHLIKKMAGIKDE